LTEKWKNKLLDLGKRNRLLYYRETKRSSLQILTPDCASLWKSFVQNEKPLVFPYYDELADYDEFSENLPEKTVYSVETNQNITDMQKTLRYLRDRTRTANEEQGTNILYLSFGFLKWKESVNSDIYFNSPIILVPVTLTVESIAAPYILSLHEDEIVINPTLCHKLENNFGLSLPSFDDDVADVRPYLKSIRELVAHTQWEVNFNVGLSLLSFLKINMYKDLIRHKDKVKQNSIIRAISGDATACGKISEELVNFDFDRHLKPGDVFQVVDADSSQMDAILCAKKVQLNDEVYRKLDALQSDKEKLNDYADQLVAKIAPLDKSIFEVNGILAHLDACDEIVFPVRTAANTFFSKTKRTSCAISNYIGKRRCNNGFGCANAR
jgi:hypothetical protein